MRFFLLQRVGWFFFLICLTRCAVLWNKSFCDENNSKKNKPVLITTTTRRHRERGGAARGEEKYSKTGERRRERRRRTCATASMVRPGRAAAKRCAYHTEQKSLERTFENIKPSIIAEVLASKSVRSAIQTLPQYASLCAWRVCICLSVAVAAASFSFSPPRIPPAPNIVFLFPQKTLPTILAISILATKTKPLTSVVVHRRGTWRLRR